MRDTPEQPGGGPAGPPPPQQPDQRQPILNLPPATAMVGAVLVGVHVLRQFLDIDSDNSLILTFGVFPANWVGGPGLTDLLSLLSHMLLHGSWLHLGFNLAALLAFGAGVERMLGARRMLIALALGGIGGAVLHLAIYFGDAVPVVGASGGISALFGLTMFAMAMRTGGWRRLASVTAIWLGLNLAFGLIGVPGDATTSIAWVAHMGGYFAGLAYGFWLMRRAMRGSPPG